MGDQTTTGGTDRGTRRYRLTGYVICHDLKFCRRAEVVVAFPREPSASEAVTYLWPVAESLLSGYGAEGCRIDLTEVQVAAEAGET